MFLCERRFFVVMGIAACSMVILTQLAIFPRSWTQHIGTFHAVIMDGGVQSSNLYREGESTRKRQPSDVSLSNLEKRDETKNELPKLDLLPGNRDMREEEYEDDYDEVEYDNFDTVDEQDEQYRNLVKLPERNDIPKIIHISKPTCDKLIKGNNLEMVKSLLFAGTFPYVSKINYTLETQNCTRFLRNRDYILGRTEEEAGFPLAYSIIMYKGVEQAERLLRAIYRPSNHYCIHVDKKATSRVQNEIQSIVKCFPNVFLSSKQLYVKWGRFSVLEAELVCMQDLLKRPGWKYFINLTGQEFPLKTNLEIVKILKILNGTNSIDANTQRRWKARRWQRAWPPPHNIQPYKGNVHVVVSRNFVKFALNDPKAQDFVKWLNKTNIPDETFFASLDNNPHLHAPGASYGRISTDYDFKPYIARFKNWGVKWGERSFDWPCKGKRVRTVCIFGIGDLHLLVSRRELFANKFHISFQPQTLDCIEEWHRNRTRDEYRGSFVMNYGFYRKMPQLQSKYNKSKVQ